MMLHGEKLEELSHSSGSSFAISPEHLQLMQQRHSDTYAYGMLVLFS